MTKTDLNSRLYEAPRAVNLKEVCSGAADPYGPCVPGSTPVIETRVCRTGSSASVGCYTGSNAGNY
ncbi:MAG: hypothetical protein NTX24_04225 [Candidatus Pacearchaeota archaeon]|nr:hypothetical protein [Candidatus Pacearchaeota archaeon]